MEYLSDKSSVARMDKNLEKISPFELKNRLIEMADESCLLYTSDAADE